MEYINKVKLRGKVGKVSIKTIQNYFSINFGLLVVEIYKSSSGEVLAKNNWFSINYLVNPKKNPTVIKEGDEAEIEGTLRTQSLSVNHIDTEDANPNLIYIKATTVKIIENGET